MRQDGFALTIRWFGGIAMAGLLALTAISQETAPSAAPAAALTNTLPVAAEVATTNPPPTLAEAAATPADTNRVAAPAELPKLWFPVGEELIYEVQWGVIPVGTTHITTSWVVEDGRNLLSIRYRTRSNKVIATLYPVDDTIESLIDPVTFLPIWFEKNLKEGRHRYHERTTFDHVNLKAYWVSFLKDKQKEFDIEPDTRDLVTFMYYMRSQTLREGVQTQARVMADEKVYDLFLDAKRIETVKLDGYGKVPSLRVEPQAQFEGLFIHKGRMTLWVSRDARCVCTQMRASVPVADVRVMLKEVRGPGNDLWVTRGPKKKD